MPGPRGILGAIVERTLADVAARAGAARRGDLEAAARARAGHRRPFAPALRRSLAEDPVRFIAEVKKASPSRGVLAPDLDAGALAAVYRGAGAAAISVVTEPHFFRGHPALLDAARVGAGDRPLLRKDFHVHELQILETAAGEADALLFIVAALEAPHLRDLLLLAADLGLEHLVEVEDPAGAETALAAGARVVGVNNRDLATFRVDVSRTEAVLPVVRGTGAVLVAESGIHDRGTVLRLQTAGVDALLVGEALVTAPDPAARLRELRGDEPPCP